MSRLLTRRAFLTLPLLGLGPKENRNSTPLLWYPPKDPFILRIDHESDPVEFTLSNSKIRESVSFTIKELFDALKILKSYVS